MKVALINPPITSRERYGMNLGDIGGHQAPLGLCYIAAFLEKRGFEVLIIDAEAEKLDNIDTVSRITGFRPDAIGITSTTVAFDRAKGLAGDIKALYGNVPIVIGGPHVSSNPIHALSVGCFDYGVFGEGEITAVEIFNAIKTGSGVEGLRGSVYRKNGKVVCNEPRPYIDNLDSLPFPAMHLLKKVAAYRPPLGSYLKRPVVSMVTSRGCPHKCIFCDNNTFGRAVRFHSPEYVVSGMERAVKDYGAREIAFLDDTFTLSHDRLAAMMSLMRRRSIRIRWSCMTRADRLTRELVKEMKKAGCWQIGLGAESGNQAVLDFIKKGITLRQVRDVVGWCAECGIYVKGFFMIGHPIDNMGTIDETIKFAKSVQFSDVVVSISTPIPGTELYSIAANYGDIRSSDPSEYSYWKPVFVPRGMDRSLLFGKQKQLYAEFYFRFGIILKQVRKIRSPILLFKYMTNAVSAAFSLYGRS